MKKLQNGAGDAIFVIFFFSIIIIINCQICSPSQYFNGQRCAPCRANCICNSQNTCFDCLPGYAFDATFSNCLQCPQSTDLINIGCAQCCSQISGTSFVCSSCANQAYVFLRGGQCLKLNGCLSLTINGLCNSCQGGYYLFEGTCYPCDSSCSTCYDSTSCLTCNQGFYNKTDINNAFCQTCPVGCQSCTSATTCSSCLSGYRFSTPNCISCGNINCLSCTVAGCTLCASGTTLISGTCYLCTDGSKLGTAGCLTCSTTIGNMIQCNSCADTYYLNSGACSLCSSHFSHSSRCNSTTVFQCLNDYNPVYTNRYYLYENQCIANSKSCKIMKNSNGDCSSCYFQGPDNYYKLNGVQCTKCVLAGCASFSTSCQCLSCQNGYRFINNLCSACQNLHCITCQSDVQSCQACDTGYGLISSACILCVKSNCNNCDGDYTLCSICDNGYYLNSGNCYKCQTNCVTCTSSTYCSLCDVGYYLQANGRCQLLPLNCLQVDPNYLNLNVAVCKKCAYGYQVIDGNCYPCSQSLYNLGQCQKYCPNYYALLKFEIQTKYSLIFIFLAIVYLALL